jgi:hypothetical protein
MKLPLISRKKHEQILKDSLDAKWEECREILIIRGRLWAKNLAMYEEQIRELRYKYERS